MFLFLKSRQGVSPVIATVLLVIITVVLSVTFYVMLANSLSLPGGSQVTPMGLTAKLEASGNVTVNIVSAPTEARINGSVVGVISASSGEPVVFNATLYYGGLVCGNYSSATGWSDVKTDFYKGGMFLLLQKNSLIAKGDTVQISGTGFAFSSCTIM